MLLISVFWAFDDIESTIKDKQSKLDWFPSLFDWEFWSKPAIRKINFYLVTCGRLSTDALALFQRTLEEKKLLAKSFNVCYKTLKQEIAPIQQLNFTLWNHRSWHCRFQIVATMFTEQWRPIIYHLQFYRFDAFQENIGDDTRKRHPFEASCFKFLSNSLN